MNLIHSTKNKNKKSFCIDNEYENQLSTKNGSHLGNCSNTYKMSCALSNTYIKIIITQNICNIFNQICLVENRFSIPFYSFVFPLNLFISQSNDIFLQNDDLVTGKILLH